MDNCGGEAIVVSQADAPAMRWLERQKDHRVRQCTDTNWWNVIPLSGGAGVAPEQLFRLVRTANVDDLRAAVACAMPAGVTTLLELFPEIRQEPFIVGRSLIAKSPIRSVRFRLERGDPTLAKASVRSAEMLIVGFVERVIVAESAAVVRLALREVVVALSTVIGAAGSSGVSLVNDERDRLIAFLIEAAQTGGLPLREAEDLLREARAW